MGAIEDYGLDTFCRKWLLVLLDTPDDNGRKASDILHINKILLYFEYLIKQKNIQFSNYKMGGVSDEVREIVDNFEEYDLLEKENGNGYVLTPDGETATQEIKPQLKKEDLKVLQFAKEMLNDLTDDELLYFMYRTIPSTTEHSTHFERLEKNKDLLVSSLYKKEKISASTAAKWVGKSEEEFLKHNKIKLASD